MTSETTQHAPEEQQFDALPFPYSQRPYCPYEPFERRVKSIRVLVVNDLLRDESDLSDTARREWGESAAAKLERERYISGLALDNIVNNIKRLVEEPDVRVAHISEAVEAAAEFSPEAIVLSGTLSDFDYYDPGMLRRFAAFAVKTTTPILGICGGHQLIGLSFGVGCVTLDDKEPGEQREGRNYEYQYRFIRITEPADPIFEGISEREGSNWHDYTPEGDILRVWQNHGLQLPHLPEGFKLLATSYLCRNQMMVKRADGQLIYTVQFHLEKSFQDLTRKLQRIDPNLAPEERKRLLREEASARTLWAHPNESRHGRLLFENFLLLALEHNKRAG
jgi:GMP synthase-like glutamine amidotransferase